MDAGIVSFEQYSLTDDLCGYEDIPSYYQFACITYYPGDEWLYIIVVDRIFKWNVNTKDGEWSGVSLDEYMPKINISRGCTIDNQMKYVWITDDDGHLIAYDVESEVLIDVNSYNYENYPIEYYWDLDDNGTVVRRLNDTEYHHRYGGKTRWPKMIPLNDNFTFISSFDDYYVLYSGINSDDEDDDDDDDYLLPFFFNFFCFCLWIFNNLIYLSLHSMIILTNWLPLNIHTEFEQIIPFLLEYLKC